MGISDIAGVKDNEMIKMAYAMAVGAYRFKELNDALHDRLDQTTDFSDPGQELDERAIPVFQDLEPHFENALSLMKSQGRRFDTVRGSFRLIDSDSRPAVLIRRDGKVMHANAAAVDLLGVSIGQPLKPSAFEYGQHDLILKALSKLESHQLETIIQVFGMISADQQDVIKVALRTTLSASGEILGHLSVVNISWLPGTGKEFARLFGLTRAEVEIAKSVVMGRSLSDLAKGRGRSIGTVRQQTKTLLSKLNLRSQTELACLYSGFSEIQENAKKSIISNTPDEPWRSYHIMPREDGRIIDYEIVGPEKGRPVLFLPGLLGGMSITAQMRDMINKQNLKLIMAWRPKMSNSTPNGPANLKSIESYAQDIEALLDDMGIDTCDVIGHLTGSMHAFGCAHYLQSRISRVILVNGLVPCLRGPHVKYLDVPERMRLFMARHARKIGSLIIHTMMARIDAGYDEETVRELFANSPIDQETVDTDPEIKLLFRHAQSAISRQGYDYFMHEFTLLGKDWEVFVQDRRCPVLHFVGEKNFGYSPVLVHTYAKDQAQYTVIPVAGAAHLALYQKPEFIFARIGKIEPVVP